jgi:hypothetical protein
MTEITRADISKEQYAHLRPMDDILYKIPPLFTAVLMAFNNLNQMDGDMKVSIKPFVCRQRSPRSSSCYGRPLWSLCSASFTPRTARVKTQPLVCTGDHLGKLRPLRSRRSGRAAIRPECANSCHSLTVWRTSHVDPEHPFEIGPMNRRFAPHCGRRG